MSAADLRLTRIFPAPEGPEEVLATEAYAHPERCLRANMVSSVDGAAVLEGRVGALTGPADQSLLLLLRSLCDVLVVGAGTLRAEGYGPVKALPPLREVRRQTGRPDHPRLAVLTRAIDVDLDSTAFTQAPERPVILTTSAAAPDRLAAAERVADVVIAGDTSVDLVRAVAALHERGLTRILSEGGPAVLAGLFAADLVDELCWAIAPSVTGGAESRITRGPALPQPRDVRLSEVYQAEGFLFTRYQRPLG